MNYFEQLAQNFAQQLIRPRRYNYSEELLEHFFIENPQLQYRFVKTLNKRQQLLQTLLVKKSINESPSKTCIVYAHGLGSNKLQVLSILKHLKKLPYDICSFDFSGSGKSEGKFTSYGLRQQDDVAAILAWLDQTQCYEEYILWGRSMGSVAIILSQGLLLNPKVGSIVLDSPFSSFEKVSLEIASKKSYIPEIFLQPLLSYLKQYFEQKSEFNPFNVNVTDTISRIGRKILFIYSKNDTVVSHSHSTRLKINCKQVPEEIEIVQDHNMQRSRETHLRVSSFIDKNSKVSNSNPKKYLTETNAMLDQTIKLQRFDYEAMRGRSLNKNRGISVMSKESAKQNNQFEANRQRRPNNNNSNTKINLIITQSMILNRKNSIKQSVKEKRLKPASSIIKLSHDSQHFKMQTLRGKSTPKSVVIQHPPSLVSLNSVETVQSNFDQCYKQENSNRILFSVNLNKTCEETFNPSQKYPKQLVTPKLQKNTLNIQPNQLEKINSFNIGSFIMHEDLNLKNSINPIYFNRRRPKQPQQEKDHQQKQQNLIIEGEENLMRQKNEIFNVSSTAKRSSIQLRRKNRFVFM